MSTFREATATPERDDGGPTPPRHTAVFGPDIFADSWAAKPKADVCIGFRLIPSRDIIAAKAQAEEQARKWYPRADWADLTPEGIEKALTEANDAYNDAVMRHCVARATCDANDVTKGYFKHAEDTVREALTEDGVRRLWDQLLIVQAQSAVGILRAGPEDTERLARILADGRAFEALSPGDQIEVSTLIGYVLTLLVGTGQAHEKSFDGAGGGYNVRSAHAIKVA